MLLHLVWFLQLLLNPFSAVSTPDWLPETFYCVVTVFSVCHAVLLCVQFSFWRKQWHWKQCADFSPPSPPQKKCFLINNSGTVAPVIQWMNRMQEIFSGWRKFFLAKRSDFLIIQTHARRQSRLKDLKENFAHGRRRKTVFWYQGFPFGSQSSWVTLK